MNRHEWLINNKKPSFTIYDLFHNLELEDTALSDSAPNMLIHECMIHDGQLWIKYDSKVRGTDNLFYDRKDETPDWYLAYYLLKTTQRIVKNEQL